MIGEVYTTEQLAKILQVSPAKVRQLEKSGQITAMKMSGQPRFHGPTVLKQLTGGQR